MSSFNNPLEIFFLLLCGHALMDYSLQTTYIAKEKNPWSPIDMAKVPSGQIPNIFWPWVLSAHSLLHGMSVMLITGSLWLGIAEFVCHWFIDLIKCAHGINIHIDQILHISCKIIWVYFFIVWSIK